MTLTTHHLEFSATAVTPLELDDQAGAAMSLDVTALRYIAGDVQ